MEELPSGIVPTTLNVSPVFTTLNHPITLTSAYVIKLVVVEVTAPVVKSSLLRVYFNTFSVARVSFDHLGIYLCTGSCILENTESMVSDFDDCMRKVAAVIGFCMEYI